MNLPQLTRKRALFVLVLVPLVWLAYRTCPCIIQDDQTASRFRVTRQPNTCVVMEMPSFWVLPDSTPSVSASDVEFYELRTSRQRTDRLFVGLRSMTPYPPNSSVPREAALRSKNRFAFTFHPAEGGSHAKVDGFRPASDKEWADAEGLPYLDSGAFMDLDLKGNVTGDEIVFNGQRFPKREKYS